eukprot:m.62781 g.62781  ORF g.62781 m.62781 type:complete len:419 (+) comp23198_c0_seq4:748-2004(+)
MDSVTTKREGVRFVEPVHIQAADPDQIAQSQERQRKLFQFFLDKQEDEASYRKPWRDEIAAKLSAVGGWDIGFGDCDPPPKILTTSTSSDSNPVIHSEPMVSPSLTEQIRLPQGKTPVKVLDGVLPNEWCEKLIAAHTAVGFTPQHVLDATVGSPIQIKTQELLSKIRSNVNPNSRNYVKPMSDDKCKPNQLTQTNTNTSPNIKQDDDNTPQSQQQHNQHHDQQYQAQQSPSDVQMDTYRTADGKRKNTAEVIEIVSQEFADAIWRRVCAFVPKTIQISESAVITGGITGNASVVGLIPVFRFMRYKPGQAFKAHHDPSRLANKHPVTGKSGRFISLVTLALYLNDADEFEGGGLHFVELVRNPHPTGKALIGKPFATVTPKQGRCGIFEHSHLHESEVIVEGVKHMVQCDVLYELTF